MNIDGEVVGVWECRVNNDCEGRTGTHTAGWFLTQDEASEHFLKSEGYKPTDFYINHHQAVKKLFPDGKSIYYLLTEIKISTIEVKIRERALAKLDEDEKRVLGLK